MASGSKYNEALQMILNNLIETDDPNMDLGAMEAENTQLRFKQMEIMAKLNTHSTVNSSSLFVKDMLSRQQIINRTRSETKEQLAIQNKIRSGEAALQITSRKQKLQEVDKFMTLPYNEVQEKILEMERKLKENRSKINELIPVWEKLSLLDKNKGKDISQLSDTLKCIEKEQRNLLEKYKQQ